MTTASSVHGSGVGDIIELCDAQLCQDCEAITAPQNGRCGRCGSQSLLSLASVLNRRAEGERDEVL